MDNQSKTPEQAARAVAIAKDVLDRLEADRLKLSIGKYIEPLIGCPQRGSLQEQVDVVEEYCEVCQLGAFFLSYARLYNNVECDTIHVGYIDESARYICRHLLDTFTAQELCLMELAFENDMFIPNYLRYNFKYNDDSIYQMNYIRSMIAETLKERVKWVCWNIISSGGYFDPQPLNKAAE